MAIKVNEIYTRAERRLMDLGFIKKSHYLLLYTKEVELNPSEKGAHIIRKFVEICFYIENNRVCVGCKMFYLGDNIAMLDYALSPEEKEAVNARALELEAGLKK